MRFHQALTEDETLVEGKEDGDTLVLTTVMQRVRPTIQSSRKCPYCGKEYLR